MHLLSISWHSHSQSQLSSLHVTFPSENECHKLTEKGFLPRIGMQYHWKNRNYKKWLIHLISSFYFGSLAVFTYSFRLLLFYVGSFDDFLMDMKQSKRKNIRQERKKVDICRFYQLVLEFYPIALSSVCVFISIRQ